MSQIYVYVIAGSCLRNSLKTIFARFEVYYFSLLRVKNASQLSENQKNNEEQNKAVSTQFAMIFKFFIFLFGFKDDSVHVHAILFIG